MVSYMKIRRKLCELAIFRGVKMFNEYVDELVIICNEVFESDYKMNITFFYEVFFDATMEEKPDENYMECILCEMYEGKREMDLIPLIKYMECIDIFEFIFKYFENKNKIQIAITN